MEKIKCKECKQNGVDNNCFITGRNNCGHNDGDAYESYRLDQGEKLYCTGGCEPNTIECFITGLEPKCGHDNGTAYQIHKVDFKVKEKNIIGKFENEEDREKIGIFLNKLNQEEINKIENYSKDQVEFLRKVSLNFEVEDPQFVSFKKFLTFEDQNIEKIRSSITDPFHSEKIRNIILNIDKDHYNEILNIILKLEQDHFQKIKDLILNCEKDQFEKIKNLIDKVTPEELNIIGNSFIENDQKSLEIKTLKEDLEKHKSILSESLTISEDLKEDIFYEKLTDIVLRKYKINEYFRKINDLKLKKYDKEIDLAIINLNHLKLQPLIKKCVNEFKEELHDLNKDNIKNLNLSLEESQRIVEDLKGSSISEFTVDSSIELLRNYENETKEKIKVLEEIKNEE